MFEGRSSPRACTLGVTIHIRCELDLDPDERSTVRENSPESKAYQDASYELLVIRYEYEEGGSLIEDNDPLGGVDTWSMSGGKDLESRILELLKVRWASPRESKDHRIATRLLVNIANTMRFAREIIEYHDPEWWMRDDESGSERRVSGGWQCEVLPFRIRSRGRSLG